MPRIPQNLRERAIGMLNAGMAMNAVVMNIGCSTRAIRHLRQRFQATEHTKDRPHSGRPCVTTHGQDHYIRNTYLRNRFQTVLRTKSVTKKEMNKCKAEIYDPGGIRTRAARLISQNHNH